MPIPITTAWSSQLPEDVPLFMGAATARILRESQFFTPMGLDREPAELLADRQPLVVGPFTITPFLVDHSAFDAYALLVEADGRRLFYSGDFRAHGRKAELFERLLRGATGRGRRALDRGHSARPRRELAGSPRTRPTSSGSASRSFRAEGIVLVAFSMQNIDRLVSFYRAALRADRDLVLDLYGAAVTLATGNPNIPQPGADRLRFFVPKHSGSRSSAPASSSAFNRSAAIASSRSSCQEAARLVLSFRPSMIRDLERAKCLRWRRGDLVDVAGLSAG